MGVAWSVLRGVAHDHRVHDAESGAIYAAGASEWHGASIWRSLDLGETWTQSSDGLEYGDSGLKLSKVSGLTAAHGRLLAGAEVPGVFESRDGGQTWKVLSRLEGQPGSDSLERPGQPAAGGTSAFPAILPHPEDPGQLLGDRPGDRHLRDDGRRQPRGRPATRACAPTGRWRTRRSATASTSS